MSVVVHRRPAVLLKAQVASWRALCDMIITFLLTLSFRLRPHSSASTRRARLREADRSLPASTLTLDCLPRDAEAVAP